MTTRLLQSHPNDLSGDRITAGGSRLLRVRVFPFAGLWLILAALLLSAKLAGAAQAENPKPEPIVPDAPQPVAPVNPATKPATPCLIKRSAKPPAEQAPSPGGATPDTSVQQGTEPVQSPCVQIPGIDWFARFLNGPEVKPLTPAEKARLAARNVVDPFNAITILGTAAISVGADSHSAYGPGMTGFGKYVGVSYAQDVTGEFFGTFLIPSIVHQDPHYHRMPNASYPRRITHAITQVFWTQGDNGKGMVNYANLVGYVIDDEISNLYVPGRETDFSASASRYGIGLATAPVENFVIEFLPDVARRIHIRVVLIQRIINRVAKTGGPGSS